MKFKRIVLISIFWLVLLKCFKDLLFEHNNTAEICIKTFLFHFMLIICNMIIFLKGNGAIGIEN